VGRLCPARADTAPCCQSLRHRKEAVEALYGQTSGACDVGEVFWSLTAPGYRARAVCRCRAAWQVPSSTDSNLTSAAFNASPQHLFLPNGRPCVSHCECAPVRDRKRRQTSLVAVRMRPPGHAPSRHMRPTRSRTSSITQVQRGISPFGMTVQKSQPISRRPANCKKLMASGRSRGRAFSHVGRYHPLLNSQLRQLLRRQFRSCGFLQHKAQRGILLYEGCHDFPS